MSLHLSRQLSQPIHLGTQPKTTTGMDRELTINISDFEYHMTEY